MITKALGKMATAFSVLLVLTIMYNETDAQKRQKKQTAVVKPTPVPVLPEINYTISMDKPWTHLLNVEMSVAYPTAQNSIELKLPVWTPGSYLVREYARHVQDFTVFDEAGNRVAWKKISKNTWQIAGGKKIIAKYNVYSNELTVRTNELNDDHAFWNNSALLMFPKGQISAPSTVTVKPHSNWKIATGLPKAAGKTNAFTAANFDVLYDSPFEVSNFNEITFDVLGKPHRYVFSGEGNYDMKKIADDTAKIVNECYKIFGDLPYDDYTFIVNLRGGGGLEHLNSTALQWNRFGFTPAARYQSFLSLVAHEYFHLWNVKRIRPDVLGPFDYENENYTSLLWMAEGATAYYENLLLVRAGLMTDKEFLDAKAGMIKDLQDRPGRFQTSLEEASFDAWIKYYRPDENSVNNQISYYDKGEVVNFMLDIAIREKSGGAKSFDDVMRHLYNEFFKKGKNYTPADVQQAAELAAGGSLDEFFAKHIRGRAEIDYSAIVAAIGLQVKTETSSKTGGYLGATVADEGEKLMVKSIPNGTPAYEQGLNTGDQILAIDGNKANNQFLQSYLGRKNPGDRVKITFFRFEKLRELEITLGANTRMNYSFAKVEAPNETQTRLYKDLLRGELK